MVGMAEAVRAAEARVAVEREAAAKAEKARAAEAMEAEETPYSACATAALLTLSFCDFRWFAASPDLKIASHSIGFACGSLGSAAEGALGGTRFGDMRVCESEL